MTAPSRPRRLLVAAGLLATTLAVLRDHDLVALPELVRMVRTGTAHELEGHAAPESPTRRLRAALQVQEEAWARLRDAFEPWITAQPEGAQITSPDHPGWGHYWTLRAERWPAFAASLAALSDAAIGLRAEDPDNGAYEVVAGLADVLRAASPSEHDALYYFVEDEDAYAALTRVDDPALLQRGLARIDAGLTRARFSFGSAEELSAVSATVDGEAPLRRTADRLRGSLTILCPELMFMKGGARQLVRLARAERIAGRSGEEHLSRARRMALRQGSEATLIIELLVAQAELAFVHEAWLRELAARGEAERALGVAAEQAELRRLRERAARLPDDLAVDRLGALDSVLMPAGGWKGGRHDPALGRAADHAILESLVLHALLAVGLLGLVVAAVQARRSSGADAPAAGWTFGDTLAVTLPSFALVAVLTLLHTRLHPGRSLGLASEGALQATSVQSALLVLLAPFLFAWLLRRRVLERHGLAWARPGWALGGLLLVAAGAHLALLWVAGRDQALLPVGLALAGAGALAAWRGGALGRPCADPALAAAVRGYEGRVGLASLGVALALVAAMQCALVAPRRDALWRAYDAQLARLLEREAEVWGRGEPVTYLRERLEQAPDAPTLR